MDILSYVLRSLIILLVIRSILNMMMRIRIIRHMQKNPQQMSSSPQGMQATAASPRPAPEVEMVKDELCDKMIDKEKAYIIMDGDNKHYFCSWECRQKFIAG